MNRIYAQFGNVPLENFLQIICVGADVEGITELFRQLYPTEWIDITDRVDRDKAIPYQSYYDKNSDRILSEKEAREIVVSSNPNPREAEVERYVKEVLEGADILTVPLEYQDEVSGRVRAIRNPEEGRAVL